MKILFIEDEPALQKTMGDLLRSESYEVVSATDGEQGLRLAQSEDPDIILLDIVLPRMNGLEVLKKLREANNKTPVIILTNLEGAEEVQKALDLGATTYLVKANYQMEDILAKIKRVLNEG